MPKKVLVPISTRYQPEPTIIQQAKVDFWNKRNVTSTAGLKLAPEPLKPSGNIFAMRYG